VSAHKRRKQRERERERGGGGSCAGDGNIDETSGRCFGAKTLAEVEDGGGQARGRGDERWCGREFR